MKWFIFLSFCLITFIMSSCSVTNTTFAPIHKITRDQKTPESVELLHFKPRRLALCIGLISAEGNGFSSHDECIKEARKKAAFLGADFIIPEKSGTETTTQFNPGHSTYESKGSGYLSGNRQSIYGSASQNTSAYSVGPSVSTYYFPWDVFSAWVYRPSCFGIELDDNWIVTGFHLQSNAEDVGVKLGDKVIGIDGLDVKDEKLGQHLMTVQSGDDMLFTVSRDGKRLEFTIKALPN